MAARPSRVLIVDDNVSLMETLADIVELAGFDVARAVDGATGLARLREFRPEVAIFDVVLPDSNGVDLIRQALPEYPKTKFVIMTGYAESEYVAAARALGTVEVLYKPVNPGPLVELLRRLTGTAG